MIFNSFEFAVFLPLVWGLYWSLRRHLRLQNLLVMASSYVFYGWWDWRFLLLIAFTSAWSYAVGLIELRRWEAKPSRILLAVSLLVNLGVLGYFKYWNFFVDSFVAFAHACLPSCCMPHPSSLAVILPVGISFYTFQALSYTIDVFRRNIRPTRDPVAFFAFISFFPQLVAGPIERATNLLPQFLREKLFDYPAAVVGCRQMLWGFFKKMVVADNCAVIVDQFLNGGPPANGLASLCAAFLFSIQIYCDFSGYSDIAIGCARLFGVKLMRNFAFPYFSRDIAEFWRRWHISLTTWFRDYLYIPLGGSRCSKAKMVRNTFVIFLVSGLWHGANWTFVAWGAFHAALFLPLLLSARNRKHLSVVADSRGYPTGGELMRMVGTFALTVLGWILFRAQSLPEAGRWLLSLLDVASYRAIADFPHAGRVAFPMIALLFACEWFNRREPFGLARCPRQVGLRWLLYFAVVLLIFMYAPGSQSFIYFQF